MAESSRVCPAPPVPVPDLEGQPLPLPESSILKSLRHQMTFSSWLGLFPFKIVKNSRIVPTTSYLTSTSALVVTALGLIYFCFQFYQIFEGFFAQRGIVHIVVRVVWFSSSVLSLTMTIFGIFKRTMLIHHFEKTAQLESQIAHLFTEQKLTSFAKKYCVYYSALTIVANFFVLGVNAKENASSPNNRVLVSNPSPLTHFMEQNPVLAVTIAVLYNTWAWAGAAQLELYCCVLAKLFAMTLDNISTVWKINSADDELKTNEGFWTFENGQDSVTSTRPSTGEEKQERELNADKLRSFIQLYQKMAALQGDVNEIVGPLLLVDFAQLLVMICTILFLSIRFTERFDLTLAISLSGSAACMVVRLVVLVLTLGEVYIAGQNTNLCFANLVSSKYFPVSVVNPVLAHLTAYSSNPIGFSAWGFFVITRGTLLATMSAVFTCLVVFLQS